MPSVINAKFYLTGGYSQCYLQITSMICSHDSIERKTWIEVNGLVKMGPTNLLGYHSSDKSFGRDLGGTIGGHTLTRQTIKIYNLRDHRWLEGTTNYFTASFSIPYTYGNPYVNLMMYPCGSGAADSMHLYNTGTNTHTINIPEATLPTAPRNTKINGTTSEVAITNSSTNLNITWDAPTSSGTASRLEYYVWCCRQDPWETVPFGPVTSRNMSKTAAQWGIVSGKTYVFLVRANTIYGIKDGTYTQVVKFVPPPNRPASLTLTTPVNFASPITASWSAGSTPLSSLKHYWVRVKHYANGSSTADAKEHVITTTSRSYTYRPFVDPGFNNPIKAGSVLQFDVWTLNAHDIWSTAGTLVKTAPLKGGIIRVRMGGAWKTGTVHVKINGVWKPATNLKTRVSGVWKESK